jgi:hypothetical protein
MIWLMALMSATSLQFAKPPLVITTATGGTLEVTVELNRPLRFNVGHPEEHRGYRASIEAAGGGHDIPGVWRDAVRPTCYSEGLFVERTFAAGEPVEVTLVLSETEKLTATVPVTVVEPKDIFRGRALLGCPSRAPGEARVKRCRGSAPSRAFGVIGAESAQGTSCATARRVMTSVGRWASSSRCFRDLCVRKHRMNAGYRCEAALSGEAAWEIVCRRGKQVVTGSAAE